MNCLINIEVIFIPSGESNSIFFGFRKNLLQCFNPSYEAIVEIGAL